MNSVDSFFQASLLPFVCHSHSCCRSKSYLNKKKSTKLVKSATFYILHHSLFIIFLTLSFNKKKQAKETRMSYNNIKNTIFLNGDTRFHTNSFLRCQLFYVPLANIRLHRYDSFFRFILLLSGDININRGSTSVTNNSIPLNTLPFRNCGEPTMPSETWAAGKHRKGLHILRKGLHILHLNINSVLAKVDEIRFIAKQSNASKLESVNLN